MAPDVTLLVVGGCSVLVPPVAVLPVLERNFSSFMIIRCIRERATCAVCCAERQGSRSPCVCIPLALEHHVCAVVALVSHSGPRGLFCQQLCTHLCAISVVFSTCAKPASCCSTSWAAPVYEAISIELCTLLVACQLWWAARAVHEL